MSILEEKKLTQYIGKSSIRFDKPAYISNYSSVVGKLEGNGPLGKLFDKIVTDPMFGSECWEEAESALQKETVKSLLNKSNLRILNNCNRNMSINQKVR